jgi:4'-phosphopantetheinyl transferase
VADAAVHTSLSHADGLVAIAVSMAGPVGVDIEPVHRAAVMPEVSARVAHPREYAELSMLPPRDRNDALLALWVRKEALLKAAGIGLAQEMNAFEAPTGRAVELAGGAGGTAAIRMLDGNGSSIAAVAGAPGCALHCAWLRPSG